MLDPPSFECHGFRTIFSSSRIVLKTAPKRTDFVLQLVVPEVYIPEPPYEVAHSAVMLMSEPETSSNIAGDFSIRFVDAALFDSCCFFVTSDGDVYSHGRFDQGVTGHRRLVQFTTDFITKHWRRYVFDYRNCFTSDPPTSEVPSGESILVNWSCRLTG